jgi:fermentation-respiration switch protein FrsA (DUF1100 family)
VRRERREGVELAEIRFDYGAGGLAEAYVVGDASAAGVVVAHGGAGPGKHLFVPEALELARSGFVCLLADTSFPLDGSTQERVEAMRARVLTQQRGLDVLAQEYGATRFGFYGHSAGGMQGAVLAAVEPRLDAIVVAGASGGSVRWAIDQGVSDADELDAFHRLDPEHYVAVPGSRQLLFQHGRQDTVVPLRAARGLYEAAAEPKRWREHDCGHGIDAHAPARAERLAFLEEVLLS